MNSCPLTHSVVFTPHQANLSLQQVETTRENHNQTKCQAVYSNRYIYKKIPAPKVKGTFQKTGWKDCKTQKTRDFAMRLFLLVMWESIPIKSKQHDFLHVDWTRMTPADMPRWMEKAHKALVRHKELKKLRKSRSRRSGFPQWKAYLVVVHRWIVSLKTYMKYYRD